MVKEKETAHEKAKKIYEYLIKNGYMKEHNGFDEFSIRQRTGAIIRRWGIKNGFDEQEKRSWWVSFYY